MCFHGAITVDLRLGGSTGAVCMMSVSRSSLGVQWSETTNVMHTTSQQPAAKNHFPTFDATCSGPNRFENSPSRTQCRRFPERRYPLPTMLLNMRMVYGTVWTRKALLTAHVTCGETTLAADPCGVHRTEDESRRGDYELFTAECKDYRHGRVARDYHFHVNRVSCSNSKTGTCVLV